MNEDKQIPTEIDYNDDDIARAGKRPSLRKGTYRFSITDAKTDVSKNGHLMIVMDCAALADPNDSATKVRPTIRHRLTLPFRNLLIKGHTPPNTNGFCYSFLRAIEAPDVAAKPFRDENDDLIWEGEIVTGDAAREAYRTVTEQTFAALKKFWSDPSKLIDYVFFGKVEENGDYSNIGDVWAELPADETLTSLEGASTFISDEDNETPKTTTTTAKTTNGTTTAKTAAKNGSRARV